MVEGEWSQPVERVKREMVVTDDKVTGRGNPGESVVLREMGKLVSHILCLRQ